MFHINTDKKFKALDIFYIIMMALPLICIMVLKILTAPKAEGITVTGARVFAEIPMPVQPLIISEAQVNSFAVLITLFFFCLYFAVLNRHIFYFYGNKFTKLTNVGNNRFGRKGVNVYLYKT